MPYNKLASIL